MLEVSAHMPLGMYPCLQEEDWSQPVKSKLHKSGLQIAKEAALAARSPPHPPPPPFLPPTNLPGNHVTGGHVGVGLPSKLQYSAHYKV